MTLRSLGETLHVSNSSGNVIVKLMSETKIGEPVMDSKGRRVGEVFDIFGPVDSPYASIKIKGDAVGGSTQLFLGDEESKTRRKRPPKTRSRRKR